MTRAARLRAGALAAAVLAPVPAAADCPTDTWARILSPAAQTPVLRDRLRTGSGREVLLFEMTTLEGDPMAGDFAKLWVFAVFSEAPVPCIAAAASLGSYAATTGPAGDGATRTYHLDLYRGGDHATLGFYDGAPALDEIVERALAALD